MGFDFGPLPAVWDAVSFGAGRITPLVNEVDLAEYANVEAHREGWLYPPEVKTYEAPPGWDGKADIPEDTPPIPGSARPAFLSCPPASHRLEWTGEACGENRRLPGIVMHALAFAFGGRVQFADWHLDLRVPVSAAACRAPFHVRHAHLGPLLDRVVATATTASDLQRRMMFNLLVLHARIPAYEWPWERFMWRCVEVDGCFRFAERWCGARPSAKYPQRIGEICRVFGVPHGTEEEGAAQKAARLRGELVHEASWDGDAPGYGDSPDADFVEVHLQGLVDRLLLHVLGVPCEFRRTPWLHGRGPLRPESL